MISYRNLKPPLSTPNFFARSMTNLSSTELTPSKAAIRCKYALEKRINRLSLFLLLVLFVFKSFHIKSSILFTIHETIPLRSISSKDKALLELWFAFFSISPLSIVYAFIYYIFLRIVLCFINFQL